MGTGRYRSRHGTSLRATKASTTAAGRLPHRVTGEAALAAGAAQALGKNVGVGEVHHDLHAMKAAQLGALGDVEGPVSSRKSPMRRGASPTC